MVCASGEKAEGQTIAQKAGRWQLGPGRLGGARSGAGGRARVGGGEGGRRLSRWPWPHLVAGPGDPPRSAAGAGGGTSRESTAPARLRAGGWSQPGGRSLRHSGIFRTCHWVTLLCDLKVRESLQTPLLSMSLHEKYF